MPFDMRFDELPVTRGELDTAMEALERRITGEVQRMLDDAFEGYKAHASKLVATGIASIPPMSARSEKLLRLELEKELMPVLRQRVLEDLRLNVDAGPSVFRQADAEIFKNRVGTVWLIIGSILTAIVSLIAILLTYNRLTH